MTDELTMLRQFRDSVASLSLTTPTGANVAQWAAQKLRELRRTARVYRDQSATPVAQGDEVRDALDARQIAAINDTAVFLDACAGEELEVDGKSALALVEELQDAFLTDDQRDCFHLEVRKALATLTKGARDAG